MKKNLRDININSSEEKIVEFVQGVPELNYLSPEEKAIFLSYGQSLLTIKQQERSSRKLVIATWVLALMTIVAAGASIMASYLIPRYLTEQQNKAALIQSLTQLGQNRIYGAQRYWFDVKGKESDQVISAAWKNYTNSVFAWNESNILNPMFLEYYFHDKIGRSDYEQKIIPAFTKLHNDLLDFKENGTTKVDIDSETEDTRAMFNRFISELLSI